jgi:hypothetical protein
MSKPKEYIFSNRVTIVEQTSITADSYDKALDIFLSGGGDTEEVDSYGDDWECILNADDFEDEGIDDE